MVAPERLNAIRKPFEIDWLIHGDVDRRPLSQPDSAIQILEALTSMLRATLSKKASKAAMHA